MEGRDFSAELFGATEGRDFGDELFGPQEKRPGALSAGFKSYLPQLQETFGGVKTLLGVGAERALGEGEISRGLIESGARSMKEAEEARAPLVTPERGSFTDALDKGVGAVLTEWLPFQVGSGAAQLLEALTLAGAGAVAGTVVGTPGAGTAGGAVTGVLARELAKKGVKEAAEKILKERGEEAAKAFFEQEAKKAAIDIGKKRGMNVALAGQAGFYGAGQTTSRAVEEAKKLGGSETDIELARVLPAAAISAAAEFVGDKILLGAVKDLEPGKAGKSAILDLAKNILLGIFSTGTKEVPVELIQSAAERYGAKLSLDDAQALKEYLDSAAASYAMSVVPGGVRGVRTTMAEQAAKREEPEVEPPAPEVPPAPPVEPPRALEFKPEPYIQFPDGTVAKQSEVEAYIKTLPEDQQMAMRTKLLGLSPQPGTELSPQEIAELEKQQAKAKRKPTAEELIAKARIKIGKPTTEQDVARIRDEHETAVIEGLLAQDAEMQRANQIANVQREELAPQVEAEPDVLGPAIADVDQRVREGRIMARVQDLIDRNIPFASTAITDINNKLSVINEAPLSNEERNRIQNIMGMVNVFTGFVNLPQLAPRPVDTRAENQAMEALIKERKERGPTEPLRTTPVAPSPRVEEAPVGQGVGESAALRPPSGVEPSVAEDRELVAPTVETPALSAEMPAPVMEVAAPKAESQTVEAPAAPAKLAAPEVHEDQGVVEPATPEVIEEAADKGKQNTNLSPAEMRKNLTDQIDRAIESAPETDDADITVGKMITSRGKKEVTVSRVFDTGTVDIKARELRDGVYTVEASKFEGGMGGRKVIKLDNIGGPPASIIDQLTELARRAQPDATVAEGDYVTFEVPGDGTFKVLNNKSRLAEFRKKVEANPGFKAPKKPTPSAAPIASASKASAIKDMIDGGDPQAAVDYAAATGVDINDLLKNDRVRRNAISGLEPTPEAAPEEARKDITPAQVAEQRKSFFNELRQLLNKFGLKDVALKIEQDMQEAGTYARELIRIADRADNPIRTLRHEAIHALRELGFFTDAQWKSLSKMAKDKWIDQYLKQRNVDGKPLKAGEESRYDAYMREYDGDMEKITEEAVADAFADFDATKPPAGLLQTLLRRLQDFFQAMKSALTKVESVDQIFGKVEKGELTRGKKTEAGERKSVGGIRAKAEKAKEELLTAGRAAAQKRAKVQGGRLGEELNTAINKVFVPENETYVEKIERWKDRTWQRIAQGIADQFRTIKDYSEKGYMIATTSKSIDGAMETLMRYGELYNDGGALNVRKDTKGLIEALTPLGKEVDTFFVWMALNREANQPANKKSEFIDPDTGEDLLAKLVAKRNELNQGKMKDPKTGFMVDRAVVYERARKDMMKLNRSVLDIAHGKVTRRPGEKEPLFNAAIIDDEAFDKFINDAFFVPFYREMEGKGVEAVRTASGLTGQQFSKALKGSSLPFADLYNNVLLNWSHILSASMKNAAAVQTIEDALTYGGIEAVVPNLKSQYEWKNNKVYKVGTDELVGDGSLQWNQTTDEGKGVSMVMIDGNKTYFKVTDPLLFEAISAIGYLGKSSKFLDMATKMSQWLRFGVTVSPVFRINNLLRDPVAAAAVAGGKLKFTPLDFVQNTIEGIRLYDPKNESYLGALAGGGIFNMGYRFEGDQSKLIKKLQAAGIDNESILDSDKKIRTALKTLWNKYEEYGNKAESAQRLKLYKTMRDKDMSHLEAVFYARDLMDYSKQGAWPAIRILMQTVPFLNARTQGLYKLGRDGIIPTVRTLYNVVNGKSYDQLTEEEKKQRITDTQKAKAFSAVAGAAVAASLLLYFMYKDDEDFKKRDAWDRDNFFWFKVPGTSLTRSVNGEEVKTEVAIRIPKPFEIGALATIVERITEQIVDENAEGKQFGDALSRMLVNTFAFDLPQIVRPAVDLYANKDNFTKAPIEGPGMERLSKAERMTPDTSPLAVMISRAANILLPEKAEVSPLQMDYAMQAYFGWLGATVGTVSHYAVMPFKDGAYPDARWMDRASLGLVKELPGRSGGYVTSFYDNAKAINQAMADMRHYAAMGEMEKALEIQQDKMDKIQLYGVYQRVGDIMGNIRRQINLIKVDKTMSGAEKKQAIENMQQLMNEYAKMAEDIRKQQKLAK